MALPQQDDGVKLTCGPDSRLSPDMAGFSERVCGETFAAWETLILPLFTVSSARAQEALTRDQRIGDLNQLAAGTTRTDDSTRPRTPSTWRP